MPISVTCDCGRSYQVTAEHAGKKFRCKACGERLTVRSKSTGSRDKKRQERELYEDLVGDESGDDDFEDYDAEEVYVSAPPRKLKRKPLPKQRQQRRRRGMPFTVMIAILCEAVLIIENSLLTVILLFAAWHAPGGNRTLLLGTALDCRRANCA
jgi:DNA-directed RNA polymerase subunit RPC12/RpoP